MPLRVRDIPHSAMCVRCDHCPLYEGLCSGYVVCLVTPRGEMCNCRSTSQSRLSVAAKLFVYIFPFITHCMLERGVDAPTTRTRTRRACTKCETIISIPNQTKPNQPPRQRVSQTTPHLRLHYSFEQMRSSPLSLSPSLPLSPQPPLPLRLSLHHSPTMATLRACHVISVTKRASQ